MIESKPNKYLKCISNCTSALIYDIAIIIICIFIDVSIIKNSEILSSLIPFIFLNALLAMISYETFNIIRGRKDKYFTKFQSKTEIIFRIVVIGLLFAIIYVLKYNNGDKDTIDNFRNKYEKNHPGVKLSDDEALSKYRYNNIISFLELFGIVLILVICDVVLHREFLKEVAEYKKSINGARVLEDGQ
eukprot:jgi/Orpsp1_1/1187318/evm.model.d7180000056845.1